MQELQLLSPLPNTKGSPPLSLTTILASSAWPEGFYLFHAEEPDDCRHFFQHRFSPHCREFLKEYHRL